MPTRDSSISRRLTRRRGALVHLARGRRRNGHGVEEALRQGTEAQLLQPGREEARQAVDASSDRAKAVGAVVDRVHARDDGEEHLRRADVARGLLPSDVLLARLEREAQRAASSSIDGDADHATGHGALRVVPCREVGGVRSAVSERHPESLRASDHHVGAEGTWRLEHDEREQIGGDDDPHASLAKRGDELTVVVNRAVARRILEEGAEDESSGSSSSRLPMTSSMPSGAARVPTTSMVCGWQSSEIQNRRARSTRRLPASAKHIDIASAAAVPSSRSDALGRH